MPLAQGVQDVNRFSYTFSELSLFCRIFAGFSVIFPYYLEINNIIYKIFGYVETGLWPLPGAGFLLTAGSFKIHRRDTASYYK